MIDTWCNAYSNLAIPGHANSMEGLLYDSEYDTAVDTFVYYFLFACGGLP